MSSPEPEQHGEALHSLAAWIDRAGLRVPLGMVLDALRPLDVLSSQAAMFVRPFTNGSTWESYTTALTDEAGWAELRRLLHDSGEAEG
jgi:hypothetical protein